MSTRENEDQKRWGDIVEGRFGIDKNEVEECHYVNVKITYFHLYYTLIIDGIYSYRDTFRATRRPSVIGEQFTVRETDYNGRSLQTKNNYDNGIVNNTYMIRDIHGYDEPRLERTGSNTYLRKHILIKFKNHTDLSLGNYFSLEHKPDSVKYSSTFYEQRTFDLNIIFDNKNFVPIESVAMNILIYWNAANLLFIDNEEKLYRPTKEIKISNIDVLQSGPIPQGATIYDDTYKTTYHLDSFLIKYFKSDDRLFRDFQIFMTPRRLCSGFDDVKCDTTGYLLNINRKGQKSFAKPDVAVLKHELSFMNYPLATDKLFELLDDTNYIYIYTIISPQAWIIIDQEDQKENIPDPYLVEGFQNLTKHSSILLEKIEQLAKKSDTFDEDNDEDAKINWNAILENTEKYNQILNSISEELQQPTYDSDNGITDFSNLNETFTDIKNYLDKMAQIIDKASEIDN
ncbi:uncharacterized protein LOC130663234 [Microplitis mediator]|uniref:uncharacterized protein LOC130663234 n=1 Tax=Microplitis mediator TaxID=375433 RepID=UPI002556EEF5|nr:uncharacterized protein LOC130663234 [Microplitis mediator]